MSDELLTAQETAAELAKQGVIKGVKAFTIKRWGRIGLIPVVSLGHRTKRFHLPSVQAALLKRQLKAKGTMSLAMKSWGETSGKCIQPPMCFR